MYQVPGRHNIQRRTSPSLKRCAVSAYYYVPVFVPGGLNESYCVWKPSGSCQYAIPIHYTRIDNCEVPYCNTANNQDEGTMMSGGMRLMRPHFVDPQTNIVYDTNSADFEGWLTKQSSWLKVQCRKQKLVLFLCVCIRVFLSFHTCFAVLFVGRRCHLYCIYFPFTVQPGTKRLTPAIISCGHTHTHTCTQLLVSPATSSSVGLD